MNKPRNPNAMHANQQTIINVIAVNIRKHDQDVRRMNDLLDNLNATPHEIDRMSRLMCIMSLRRQPCDPWTLAQVEMLSMPRSPRVAVPFTSSRLPCHMPGTVGRHYWLAGVNSRSTDACHLSLRAAMETLLEKAEGSISIIVSRWRRSVLTQAGNKRIVVVWILSELLVATMRLSWI